MTAFKEPELAKKDREAIKERMESEKRAVEGDEVVDEITINVSQWLSKVTLDIIGSSEFTFFPTRVSHL